jgi:hypothetical protein
MVPARQRVVVLARESRIVRAPVSFGGVARRLGVLAAAEAYAPDELLFVSRQISRPGTVGLDELMRVDPVSLRVLVSLRLASTFDGALLARRVLWVTSSLGARLWLWRLDPRSLRIIARMLLPGGVDDVNEGTLALAGNWLWVAGGDRLDRVSLDSGETTEQIRLRTPSGAEVGADARGRVLLDSEGRELSHVQRRDPGTGKLLASTPRIDGVIAPGIGGVIGRWAWINEAGGMMGYVQRIDIQDLPAVAPPGERAVTIGTSPTVITGTNAIRAIVLDHVLWVTQPGGGPLRNYCADPVTGQWRAVLPIPIAGVLLTVNASRMYYLIDDENPYTERLATAPIPAACRAPARHAPRCRLAQLTVSTRHSFAGLGSARAYIAFTNRSPRPCQMSGWPRVVGITAKGIRVRTHDWPARDFPDVTVNGAPVVTLKLGQRADAVFEGADGPASGHTCGPRLRWLQVSPPSQAGAVRISAWIAWLERYMPSCSAIRLSPVLPPGGVYRG